ncbi:MAG TPA: M23 family metallopeptidase, partial [Pyrinomonadaceae bacterium]|nr:M23 family metallopeptidase [Pyrinomonadaceae bacterium]
MSLITNKLGLRGLMTVVVSCVLFTLSMALLPTVSANLHTVSISDRAAGVPSQPPSTVGSTRLIEKRAEPVTVLAVNGEAFRLDITSDEVTKVPLRTSMPVFKAFSLSRDGTKLLYISLKRDIPSGELYLEDLSTGKATRVGSGVILSAALSPTDDSLAAYTFSNGESFGLAAARAGSDEPLVLVPENVFAENIEWDEAGSGVHYMQTSTEEARIDLVSRFASESAFKEFIRYSDKETGTARQDVVLRLSRGYAPVNSQLRNSKWPTVPTGFPELTTPAAAELRNPADEPGSRKLPFRMNAPDADHQISGDNILSAGELVARKLSTNETVSLGRGQVVKALNEGAVVREFAESGTILKFVDWAGKSTTLGLSIVNYKVPVSVSTMIQGGSLYASPGSCGLTAHYGTLGYAYDFQNLNVGAHALATADGLVVLATSSMSCNTLDGDCTDYSPTGCGGAYLGNVLVIQHADGSYSHYAHLQPQSFQVTVGTNVCQGLYIARQGHTGSTNGDFNTCGDHVHFQRQTSPDYLGQSIQVDFNDVPSNPL